MNQVTLIVEESTYDPVKALASAVLLGAMREMVNLISILETPEADRTRWQRYTLPECQEALHWLTFHEDQVRTWADLADIDVKQYMNKVLEDAPSSLSGVRCTRRACVGGAE